MSDLKIKMPASNECAFDLHIGALLLKRMTESNPGTVAMVNFKETAESKITSSAENIYRDLLPILADAFGKLDAEYKDVDTKMAALHYLNSLIVGLTATLVGYRSPLNYPDNMGYHQLLFRMYGTMFAAALAGKLVAK